MEPGGGEEAHRLEAGSKAGELQPCQLEAADLVEAKGLVIGGYCAGKLITHATVCQDAINFVHDRRADAGATDLAANHQKSDLGDMAVRDQSVCPGWMFPHVMNLDTGQSQGQAPSLVLSLATNRRPSRAAFRRCR
jgi:hypothetical protein